MTNPSTRSDQCGIQCGSDVTNSEGLGLCGDMMRPAFAFNLVSHLSFFFMLLCVAVYCCWMSSGNRLPLISYQFRWLNFLAHPLPSPPDSLECNSPCCSCTPWGNENLIIITCEIVQNKLKKESSENVWRTSELILNMKHLFDATTSVTWQPLVRSIDFMLWCYLIWQLNKLCSCWAWSALIKALWWNRSHT